MLPRVLAYVRCRSLGRGLGRGGSCYGQRAPSSRTQRGDALLMSAHLAVVRLKLCLRSKCALLPCLSLGTSGRGFRTSSGKLIEKCGTDDLLHDPFSHDSRWSRGTEENTSQGAELVFKFRTDRGFPPETFDLKLS